MQFEFKDYESEPESTNKQLNIEQIPASLREEGTWFPVRNDVASGKAPVALEQGSVGSQIVSRKEHDGYTFEEVLSSDADGFGLNVDAEDEIAFLDIDDGIDGGKLTDTAVEALAPFVGAETYIEFSTSGTGIHAFVRTDDFDDSYKTKASFEDTDIELYNNQFVRVTGDAFPDSHPRLAEGTQVVREIQEAYLGQSTTSSTTAQRSLPPCSESRTSLEVDVNEVLATAIIFANKSDYQNFDKYFLGDTSPANGDHSLADWYALSELAFVCQGDKNLIQACFERTGLYRQKCEEKHYSDNRTYLEGQIDAVLDSKEKFLDDDFDYYSLNGRTLEEIAQNR